MMTERSKDPKKKRGDRGRGRAGETVGKRKRERDREREGGISCEISMRA